MLKHPNAEMLFRAGLEVHKNGRIDDAVVRYKAALKADPDHALAMRCLASIYTEQTKYSDSLPLLLRAVELNPTDADWVAELSDLYSRMQRYGDAMKWADISVALSGGKPSIKVCHNHAHLMNTFGKWDQAIGDYENIIAIDPNMAHLKTDLAMVYLAADRWLEAWPLYDARWIRLSKMPAMDAGIPTWLGPDVQPLAGKTIQIVGEQGFGDALMFCRLIPALRKYNPAKIIYACRPELIELMRTSNIADEIVNENEDIPPSDYVIPLMGLCRHLEVTPDNFPGIVPYLKAPKGPKLSTPHFRVGLVWAGKAGLTPDIARSIHDVAVLTPLLDVRGVEYYSFQIGPRAGELNGDGVVDIAPLVHSFSDTAVLIDQMDLLIAVDTSTLHLAAALGKPVWLMNGYVGCWRWLRGVESVPYYPTVKIYRQKNPGDWSDIVYRIKGDLEALVANRKTEAA